ncbi:MAG TPA: hypothetical protein VI277_08860 [Candidatus Limnocylindria bacterium]
MNASQRGMVVGGIWLIGLGGVFLVQQAMDLDWSETWPLFLVLAGVGTAAGTLMAMAGRRIGAWTIISGLFVPAILIGIGLVLFVDLAGLADIDAVGFLGRWWPVLLIAAGVVVLIGAVLPRQRGVTEQLSILAGGATSGEVILKFGAGDLEVGAGTPGMLVEGTFEGGARQRDLGPGRIELEADYVQIFPSGDRLHWRVGLAPDLPLSLRLEGGASRSVLELADTNVTSLSVKTGASSTRIVLPSAVEHCEVRIEAGAAQVVVEVPVGVAARIRSQMGLGTSSIDEARFPRTADGWASPDYEAAAHRAEISVSGGVGTVRIG